jgi:hypothetical protein
MKLPKILKKLKLKPSEEEKGEWDFSCDKGKYVIDYVFITEKTNLFNSFNAVKGFLPSLNENESVFELNKEIVLDSKTLPKIEKSVILGIKPNKVFNEIKLDLPNFKYYNIKLSYVRIKKISESLFEIKIKLTGLCDE